MFTESAELDLDAFLSASISPFGVLGYQILALTTGLLGTLQSANSP
jgi:hypothetical protein